MRAAAGLAVLLAASTAGTPPALKSGIDLRLLDPSVRPQDDLFSYVNGAWVAKAEIPPDRVMYGTFVELTDRADADVRAIIEGIAALPRRRPGSKEQQIADMYASMLDEARIEALGASPLRPELDRIAAIKTPGDLAAEAGYLSAIGAGGPFPATVEVDAGDNARPLVKLAQGGTMLPDREYYLKADAESASIRLKYEAYLARIFALCGLAEAPSLASAVVGLETRLARAQWSVVDSRAAALRENRFRLLKLSEEMPGFDWTAWAKPQGIDRASDVLLLQPSFFRAFADESRTTALETWKAWLVARYVTAAAHFLSQAFTEARFEFFGKVLSGQELPRTRWKRGVSLVNGYLGDAVGRLYVERHFPDEARARMRKLVANVVEAFKESIKQADWLSASARDEAVFKVSRMRVKIGAPDTWREYAGLVVKPDDLVGNIQRAKKMENDQQMRMLTSPRGEGGWMVTPQTVNAYYSPARNEIVFPAAVLQPPLFTLDADDAVNYGAIGAVIGHEIGHALDERGRYLDAFGASRNWWKPQDQAEFEKRTRVLVEQFDAMSPGAGLRVNGELTLRENAGDLGGLEVAYRAYQLSLGGRSSPMIDGFTGEQRFFIGWAQAWRAKTRDEFVRQSLLRDPYAPGQFRSNGPPSNMAGFYDAFNVQPGDGMYRAPNKRTRIWAR